MLFVFYGSDVLAVRDAAFAKVDTLAATDPTITINRLEAENYAPGQLSTLSETMSLFGAKQIYVLDMPSLVPAYLEEVLEEADTLATSAHTFVLIEGGLVASDKKKLSIEGVEITELKKGDSQSFNAFTLAEALSRKDRRLLWILLQETKRESLSTEEIVGILWWQLKTLALAEQTKSALEAGVKEYPYTKAKKALSQFKVGEIQALIFSLLTLYHEGHAGKRDMDLALEAWVLRL